MININNKNLYLGGLYMDDEINLQKYRKLSVAALITGILAICVGVGYNFLWFPISNLMRVYIDTSMMPFIILPVLGVFFCFAIAAVVCGGIDLNRIKKGIYNSKGRGFDITGVVLGGLFILIVLFFLLGELLMPH